MRICVDKESVFEYVKPAPLNETMLLLTPANKCVIGVWKGPQVGAADAKFKAWKGLPDRNKELERMREFT